MREILLSELWVYDTLRKVRILANYALRPTKLATKTPITELDDLLDHCRIMDWCTRLRQTAEEESTGEVEHISIAYCPRVSTHE